MSLSEGVLQINGEISATVERAITSLRQEISQRLRASNEEIQRRLDEITPSLPPSYLNHDDFAPHERALGTNAPQSAQLLSAADCATFISRVGSPLPHDGVLVPVVLRDRVAAGLYADRLDDR